MEKRRNQIHQEARSLSRAILESGLRSGAKREQWQSIFPWFNTRTASNARENGVGGRRARRSETFYTIDQVIEVGLYRVNNFSRTVRSDKAFMRDLIAGEIKFIESKKAKVRAAAVKTKK